MSTIYALRSGAVLAVGPDRSITVSQGPLGYKIAPENVRLVVAEGLFILMDQTLPGGGVELTVDERDYLAGWFHYPCVEL